MLQRKKDIETWTYLQAILCVLAIVICGESVKMCREKEESANFFVLEMVW